MFLLFVVLLKVVVFLLAIRYYYLTNVASKQQQQRRKQPARTLIVLGSGGHTAEMMAIVKQLNKKNYSPRYYVLASTDTTSKTKVLDMEEPTSSSKHDYEIVRIKRSRHVGQSYITSVLTTLQSIWECIPLVYRLQPDLILCNGPGTCVPICLIAFMLKVFGAINIQCKIVFVESFCRVKTVSLSGRILIWIADCFVVQWPQLVQFSPKTQFFGRLF